MSCAVLRSHGCAGRAWIEFCESLKGLADYVVPSPGADRTASPAPATGAAAVDALDRREGLRYMSRVLRGGAHRAEDARHAVRYSVSA